jgi:hypothetical protein
MSDTASALVSALRDRRDWVRQSAVRTVEELAPQLERGVLIAVLLKAVEALADDEDQFVRLRAAEAAAILKAYKGYSNPA